MKAKVVFFVRVALAIVAIAVLVKHMDGVIHDLINGVDRPDIGRYE